MRRIVWAVSFQAALCHSPECLLHKMWKYAECGRFCERFFSQPVVATVNAVLHPVSPSVRCCYQLCEEKVT